MKPALSFNSKQVKTKPAPFHLNLWSSKPTDGKSWNTEIDFLWQRDILLWQTTCDKGNFDSMAIVITLMSTTAVDNEEEVYVDVIRAKLECYVRIVYLYL